MQARFNLKSIVSVVVLSTVFVVALVLVTRGVDAAKVYKLAKSLTPTIHTAEAAPSYGYKGYTYIYSSDSNYDTQNKVWKTSISHATNQTQSGSVVRYRIVKNGRIEIKTNATTVANFVQGTGTFVDQLSENTIYDYYFYSRANGAGTVLATYRHTTGTAPIPSYGYQNPRVFKYFDGSPSNVISGTPNVALIKFVVHAPTNSDLNLGYLHFNFAGNTSKTLKSVRLHDLGGKMVSPNYAQVNGSFLELSLTNVVIPKGGFRTFELLASVDPSAPTSQVTTSLVTAYTDTYQKNFEYLPISYTIGITAPVVPVVRTVVLR